MFKILIKYRTGDSFHKEDTEQLLEMEWQNIEVVKENIHRIREFNRFAETMQEYMQYGKWDKECKKPEVPTFIKFYEDDEYLPLLMIKLDNGNEVQIWPFWYGYFERFYSDEIKVIY